MMFNNYRMGTLGVALLLATSLVGCDNATKTDAPGNATVTEPAASGTVNSAADGVSGTYENILPNPACPECPGMAAKLLLRTTGDAVMRTEAIAANGSVAAPTYRLGNWVKTGERVTMVFDKTAGQGLDSVSMQLENGNMRLYDKNGKPQPGDKALLLRTGAY